MAHVILKKKSGRETMEQKRKLTTLNYKQTNIDTIIISQTNPNMDYKVFFLYRYSYLTRLM